MIKLPPNVLLQATNDLIQKLNAEIDGIEAEKHERRLERAKEWHDYENLPFYKKMFASHPRDNFDFIADIRLDDRVKVREKTIDELIPLKVTLEFAVKRWVNEVELPLKYYKVLNCVKDTHD